MTKVTTRKTVAFLGLGVMGSPIARHLIDAGYPLVVFNRTTEKARRWVEKHGGELALTPKEAAKNATIIFSCVGNDDNLREVMLGESGVIHSILQGTTVVDHSTVSAEIAKELAVSFAEKGCHFIDAPVSGGQQGAEKGELTIMCGGEEGKYEQVVPVMETYAQKVALMGPVGNGQMTKMVNQICVAGLLQGLAEGLNFAEQCGLDSQQVVEVISKGAAQSWQMDNRYQTMLAGEYNHGFAVDWMRKDLTIALSEAKKRRVELPVVSLVDGFYADVQGMGGGRWDTSSLLARLIERRDK